MPNGDYKCIVREAALKYKASGLSLIPIRTDKSKAPALSAWQQGLSYDQFNFYFINQFSPLVGIGVLGGPLSGNLEVLDFDVTYGDVWPQFVGAMKSEGYGGLLNSIPAVRTPSSGHHLYYRVSGNASHNKKVAETEEGKTLIEIRGDGGQVLAPGCPPSCHHNLGLYTCEHLSPEMAPIITPGERANLIRIASTFNCRVAAVPAAPAAARPRPAEAGQRPGDAYNQTRDCLQVLEKHGWKISKWLGDKAELLRPGKTDTSINSLSATWNHGGSNVFYCWTSNGSPFDPNASYTPFRVYSLLEHAGDDRAAAAALGQLGYGDPPKRRNESSQAAQFTDDDVPPFQMSTYDPLPSDPDLILVEPTETPKRGPSRPKKSTSTSDDDEGGYRPSDYALAVDWAASVEGKWLYVEGNQWWTYTGNHWEYASLEGARRCLQEFLVERMQDGDKVTPKPTLIRNILYLAESMLGPVKPNIFDNHPRWIPLANGIYDVDEQTLIKHDPKHLITHVSPVRYDKDAKCPLWLKFLSEVVITESGQTHKEWIDLLQEWYGYCMLPCPTAQVSMFWLGDGGNGKGVATRVLQAMAGQDSYTTIPIEQLHDPYHRAELFGKIVGFVNEPDPKDMNKNGGHFKAIVAGDSISARRPTEKVFSFVPNIRIIVSCNAMPRTRDLSGGYFRRIQMIEWRYNVPADKRDPLLDDKLAAELPGILNWAIAGLKRFQERGNRFEFSIASQRLLDDYREQEDPFIRFFKDTYEKRAESECEAIPAGYIYATYKAWCERNGERYIMPNVAFGIRLKKLGLRKDKKRMVDESDGNSKTINVWFGIALKSEMEKIEDAIWD
jgi:P4 family phage/plasmid primase-like protien